MSTDSDIQAFCVNLKRLRRAKRMTQKEMADSLRISLYKLSKIERGTLPPSTDAEILYWIYDHYGIAPSQMFSSDFYPEGR